MVSSARCMRSEIYFCRKGEKSYIYAENFRDLCAKFIRLKFVHPWPTRYCLVQFPSGKKIDCCYCHFQGVIEICSSWSWCKQIVQGSCHPFGFLYLIKKPPVLTDKTLISHKQGRRQEKWRRLRTIVTVSPPTASLQHKPFYSIRLNHCPVTIIV
jgi:hypothetical protein